MHPIDNWYSLLHEPNQTCLRFLRSYLLATDQHLTESWKYGMPFFCYNRKMCCYLWVNRKNGRPYIGFVDGNQLNHPVLLKEKRARMKILPLDPAKDLPMKTINEIVRQMLRLYKL